MTDPLRAAVSPRIPNAEASTLRAAKDVTYGWGAFSSLQSIIERLGARRVLVVTGGASFTRSGAAPVIEALAHQFSIRRWNKASPDVDVHDLETGRDFLERTRPDVVVAVGGGSVLDMSKLLVSLPPAVRAEDFVASGQPANNRSARLILVPTTSGSGAEATHFAVAYIGETKYSVAGPALRPDAIVLDPQLTLSASAEQRASSGIDAVAQAIESLWAVAATERSRSIARAALRLLLPNVTSFVCCDDESAARAMTIGSHLAGRAIDISRTTGAHAVAYHLTKRYGVPHGAAVALTLGRFIRAHAQPNVRLRSGVDPTSHREAMAIIRSSLLAATRRGLADATSPDENALWSRLCSALGLPTELAEVGVLTEEQLNELVGSTNAERLGNNPVEFTPAGLASLLR